MEILPQIMSTSRRDHCKWFQPYALDWSIFMNDYEMYAWESIRGNGRMVLYPQFPVFNYFIDFANPYLRIGLEIDGTQHDPEKDKIRDTLLSNIGWKIFRVPAREAHTEFKNLSELGELGITDKDARDSELRNWLTRSLDGVIQSIDWVYFNPIDKYDDLSDEMYDMLSWSKESLNKHRLADFQLRD
jgi:very-short-patch-repair endonuclease